MTKILVSLLILSVIFSCKTYSEDEKGAFDKEIVTYLQKKKIKCTRSESGLYYKIYEKGEGQTIQISDSVSFVYKGKLANGTVFDNQKKPITFKVKDLIAGWKEIMVKLKPKAKVFLAVPPLLGYGEHELDKIPPNSILYFEMEIISIK